METIKVIAALLLASGAGFGLLSLLTRGARALTFLEKAALAYGLGLGVVTVEMLLLSLAGIGWSLVTVAPSLIFFAAIGVFSALKNANGSLEPARMEGYRLGRFEKTVLTLLFLQIAYVFFRALIKPLEAYDAVIIYGIKAKACYLARAVPDALFTGMRLALPHADYPLHGPLAEAYLFFAAGSMNDQLVKLIFPLYYSAALALFFAAVRRCCDLARALLGTFALASVPQFAAYGTNGYLDLSLAFYWFAALFFLVRWIENKDEAGHLLLSAFMAGLGGWCKNEGMVYIGIAVLLLSLALTLDSSLIFRRKILLLAIYCAVSAAVVLPWLLLKARYNIGNEEIGFDRLVTGRFIASIQKVPVILYGYEKEFFGPKKWLIVWPAIAFAYIVQRKRALSGADRYVTLSVVAAVAAYTAVYLASPLDTAYFVGKTWSRFLLHFLPVALYGAIRLTKEGAWT